MFTIPLAPGLKDEPGLRDRYFNEMCDRLEQHVGMDIRRTLCTAMFEEFGRLPSVQGQRLRPRQHIAPCILETKDESKLPGLFSPAN